MSSTTQALVFLSAGALLANVATVWALSSRPAWQRLLVPAACFGAWIAASLLADDRWPAAELPGHAMAVAAAMFCVFEFPVFVVKRWRRP